MPEGKYYLCLMGQDGIPVYGETVSSRNSARWAIKQDYVLEECRYFYKDDFYLTDLIQLTVDELRQHAELTSAIGIELSGTSQR